MPTTGNVRTDVISLLQICRDIEMYCAQIYREYENRYTDDDEMRTLWHKTAQEEENHMRTFQMAIVMRKEQSVVAVHVDPLKATQILNMLKGLYAGIQAHPPSKLDALRSAIKLEENLAQFHLDAMAEFQDEGLKKVFNAMMKADDRHIQAIRDLYQKRLEGRGAGG